MTFKTIIRDTFCFQCMMSLCKRVVSGFFSYSCMLLLRASKNTLAPSLYISFVYVIFLFPLPSLSFSVYMFIFVLWSVITGIYGQRQLRKGCCYIRWFYSQLSFYCLFFSPFNGGEGGREEDLDLKPQYCNYMLCSLHHRPPKSLQCV